MQAAPYAAAVVVRRGSRQLLVARLADGIFVEQVELHAPATAAVIMRGHPLVPHDVIVVAEWDGTVEFVFAVSPKCVKFHSFDARGVDAASQAADPTGAPQVDRAVFSCALYVGEHGVSLITGGRDGRLLVWPLDSYDFSEWGRSARMLRQYHADGAPRSWPRLRRLIVPLRPCSKSSRHACSSRPSLYRARGSPSAVPRSQVTSTPSPW